MRDDTGVTEKERKWGTVAHLSAFLVFVLPVGGNILGPLAVLLVMKEEGEFIEFNAKEALNFQISMTIYVFLASLTVLILIGFALVPLLFLIDLVLVVRAAIEASERKRYEYPFTMRLV
jgi:uncharacterized Tic20 family protein